MVNDNYYQSNQTAEVSLQTTIWLRVHLMIINGVFGQIVEYDNHCQYEIDKESKILHGVDVSCISSVNINLLKISDSYLLTPDWLYFYNLYNCCVFSFKVKLFCVCVFFFAY